MADPEIDDSPPGRKSLVVQLPIAINRLLLDRAGVAYPDRRDRSRKAVVRYAATHIKPWSSSLNSMPKDMHHWYIHLELTRMLSVIEDAQQDGRLPKRPSLLQPPAESSTIRKTVTASRTPNLANATILSVSSGSGEAAASSSDAGQKEGLATGPNASCTTLEFKLHQTPKHGTEAQKGRSYEGPGPMTNVAAFHGVAGWLARVKDARSAESRNESNRIVQKTSANVFRSKQVLAADDKKAATVPITKSHVVRLPVAISQVALRKYGVALQQDHPISNPEVEKHVESIIAQRPRPRGVHPEVLKIILQETKEMKSFIERAIKTPPAGVAHLPNATTATTPHKSDIALPLQNAKITSAKEEAYRKSCTLDEGSEPQQNKRNSMPSKSMAGLSMESQVHGRPTVSRSQDKAPAVTLRLNRRKGVLEPVASANTTRTATPNLSDLPQASRGDVLEGAVHNMASRLTAKPSSKDRWWKDTSLEVTKLSSVVGDGRRSSGTSDCASNQQQGIEEAKAMNSTKTDCKEERINPAVVSFLARNPGSGAFSSNQNPVNTVVAASFTTDKASHSDLRAKSPPKSTAIKPRVKLQAWRKTVRMMPAYKLHRARLFREQCREPRWDIWRRHTVASMTDLFEMMEISAEGWSCLNVVISDRHKTFFNVTKTTPLVRNKYTTTLAVSKWMAARSSEPIFKLPTMVESAIRAKGSIPLSSFVHGNVGLSSLFSDVPAGSNMAFSANKKQPARETVLGTTELLENILLHLPINDILVCQRTCQAFKNCYTNSKQLQIKTFQQVRKTVVDPPPTHTFSNGVLQLPFTTNPTLFTSPSVGVINMPLQRALLLTSPVGVERLMLVVESGHPPDLWVRFNNYPLDPARDLPVVGSWSKQYLMDPRYPVTVRLEFKDNTTENNGRMIIHKSALVSFWSSTHTIGQQIEICKIINWYLGQRLFDLEPVTVDLQRLILGVAWEERTSEAAAYGRLLPTGMHCSVTTTRVARKLN